MKLLRDKVLCMAKELRQSEKANEVAQCPGAGITSSEVIHTYAAPSTLQGWRRLAMTRYMTH